MLRLLILAVISLAASAHAAPARLTEPAVRAFVAKQEQAWNAKDLRGYFAGFTADARFADRARASDNSIVPNGTATLAQAQAQARRFFAGSRFHETATVDRVEIAPDGRQARVLGHEISRIETPGRPARTLCAETEQIIVLDAGRLRSKGQTDTAIRCPHG
ncbi:MAG: hypothetical protein ACJ798_01095 [Phenylobacterium sp.]